MLNETFESEAELNKLTDQHVNMLTGIVEERLFPWKGEEDFLKHKKMLTELKKLGLVKGKYITNKGLSVLLAALRERRGCK